MQIKIINIPLDDESSQVSELNRILANNRILEVEQRFFQNEKGGCWTFCIRYIPTAPTVGANKEKVDYKQLLSDPEFKIFSRLREIRKQLAIEDAVPAFAVFTDEELSHIAKLSELEIVKLTSIPGIGNKRVEKYGKIMLEIYHTTTKEK